MAKADKFKEAPRRVWSRRGDRTTHRGQLDALLGDAPAWEGSMSASKPLVAPDGHVTLSQEDIDKRDELSGDPRTAPPRRHRQPHDRLRRRRDRQVRV